MFDFEKLMVYHKAKYFNKQVQLFLESHPQSKHIENQLSRASFSVMLNIAEGTGRFTDRDKRNFYVIARGSVFECVSIFDFLKDQNKITEDQFEIFYSSCEEQSKMLFGMIRGLS